MLLCVNLLNPPDEVILAVAMAPQLLELFICGLPTRLRLPNDLGVVRAGPTGRPKLTSGIPPPPLPFFCPRIIPVRLSTKLVGCIIS